MALVIPLAVGAILGANALLHLNGESEQPDRDATVSNLPQRDPLQADFGAPRAVGKHALAKGFALIAGPEEVMPTGLQRKFRENGGKPVADIDLDHAQEASTPFTSLWVAHNDRVLCLIQNPEGALACAPSWMALMHGVTLGVTSQVTESDVRPDYFLTMGLMPDTVKAVRVQVGVGPVQVLPVRGNVFALRSRDPIKVRSLIRRL